MSTQSNFRPVKKRERQRKSRGRGSLLQGPGQLHGEVGGVGAPWVPQVNLGTTQSLWVPDSHSGYQSLGTTQSRWVPVSHAGNQTVFGDQIGHSGYQTLCTSDQSLWTPFRATRDQSPYVDLCRRKFAFDKLLMFFELFCHSQRNLAKELCYRDHNRHNVLI